MPTYYNGKEITSESIMSGVNLTGKPSIRIGGFDVTLSTPPPRDLEMFIYGRSGSSGIVGHPSSMDACTTGVNALLTKVFVSATGDKDYYLFLDINLTIPLSPGWYWSDDTTNIGGGFDPAGVSISIDPNYLNFPGSGLVFEINPCRR